MGINAESMKPLCPDKAMKTQSGKNALKKEE
jgi:hypothetical protein